MYQDDKEDENSSVLKIAWEHEYEDSKTTVKELWKTNYSGQK